MYSIVPALGLGLALAGRAAADFSVYKTYAQGVVGGTGSNYSLFTNPPDCSDAEDAYVYVGRSDVSSQNGIRCKGCTGDGDIEELEMHAGDTHWTYYGSSGELVDKDNNHVGSCFMDESDDYDCNIGIGHINGDRLLTCTTDLRPNGLGN